MFHQTAGLIQCPLTANSVLVVHLLLVPFAGGQSQLIGSSRPIVAIVGDDIILPCHLEPVEDVTANTLEWSRSNLQPRFVHVWRAGQELINMKNPSFSGRTSLFTDELKHGNISLKLSRVKPADEGRYRCLIPKKQTESFVELLVGAASSPVISLAGTDKDKGGVVLQCESKGWYPEPELLWLDAEGKLLSAGPTETVRGPDVLYTVSSRVTVEKRHSNSFTCRVQQKITNQIRDAQIHVPDDFFKDQCSSSPVITGLAVTLAVSIMIILSFVFVVLKRKNVTKTKRRQREEQLKQKQDELQQLQEEKKKQEAEQQQLQEEKKKQEAERQQLQEEKKKQEAERQQLQEEKKKQEAEQQQLQGKKKKQKAERQQLQEEKKKQEAEQQQLQEEKKKQEAERQQLQEEKKKQEAEQRRQIEELETKRKQILETSTHEKQRTDENKS